MKSEYEGNESWGCLERINVDGYLDSRMSWLVK
jgi:hypothetical protein